MIKRLSGNWLVVLLLLLVVALGVVTAGRLTAQAVRAEASPEIGPMAVFVCTPADVGVFTNRVHVRCTTSVNLSGNIIWWWTYPTSDSAGASRFLSLFETAKATGSTVTLYYDANDLTGSSFGCGNGDCRRIWGATSP